MKKFIFLLFLVFSLVPLKCAYADDFKGEPLQNFLNEDGTLNLPRGTFIGSIDPTGYKLISAEGEEPRFEEIEEENFASGDENWDPNFNLRGANFYIFALLWDGQNLYAGGSFTMIGKTAALRIAKWDGINWSSLGSGTNDYVYALTWASSEGLYAGGQFEIAGDKISYNIGRWDLDFDNDGTQNGSDCSPWDPSFWAVPSPARMLMCTGHPLTTLSWTPPQFPGGTVVYYDVLRSVYPSDFSSAYCIEKGITSTSTTDDGVPVNGYYYLIRARNLCGDSLGPGYAICP